MKKKKTYTIEYIKSLGKIKDSLNTELLLKMFKEDLPNDIKREIASSIGRQNDNDRIILFIEKEFLSGHPMEIVYQMFRTCLYKKNFDSRFGELGERIRNAYKNEVLDKMSDYYNSKKSKKSKFTNIDKHIFKPTLLIGDSEETIKRMPKKSVNLVFTSPPYYNAKEYSDYHSYKDYLAKMKKVFEAVNEVLEDGRFFIINVSPVISKRPGREFESIRYPINFDFHKILEEAGFYFIDEIQWIKPEPSVPNRIGGYLQTRTPLSYKPNCINESILVYRKKCNFLIDYNISKYISYNRHQDESVDTSNCWFIPPVTDKDHPAVFPLELCRRIIKYYSFENDVVLDPFAGSGTLGRVAIKMKRIPIMCEINEDYAKVINEREGLIYDIRK
jgi:DNA modification methylase